MAWNLWEVSNNNNELTMVAVSLLILILAILWQKLKPYKTSNGPPLPPGPRSLPIIGYLPFIRPNLHTQLTNIAQTYGPIFKLHLGSKLLVVVNTAELAKVVVHDLDEFFSNRDQSVAITELSYLGQDVVFSNNNSNWRRRRKIFVHEILRNKNLEGNRCFDEVKKMIKHVFSQIGTKVNVREIAFSAESNLLTRMLWGDTSGKEAKYGNLAAEVDMIATNLVDIQRRANLSDFFPSLARFDLQRVKRDMKKELKDLDQIYTSRIKYRVECNSKTQHEGEKDVLQVLLDHKDPKDETSLNMTEIKAILSDFLIAGSETTATVIEWVMANVMQNHKVMKRVQEELTEVVGQNKMVEEFHLPKLQYLDATIKETLRLYPTVPFLIPRSPSKDCMVGGYTIPKGSTVFLNVWSIHRDPRYWETPLEFKPERFLTKKWDYNGNNVKFFPFGSGRRLCAGVPMAEKMLMFTVASLLHSFDWSLPKGEEHDFTEKFGITLRKIKPLIAVPSQRLLDGRLYG